VNLADTARETPIADLPKLAGLLAEGLAIVLARIVTEKETADSAVSFSEPDRLLTAEEAAARLGLTTAQLARKRGLPFRKKISERVVRYSARGLERFLKHS